jgi:hypothetical protein
VLVGVTGRAQGTQPQSAEVELVAVTHSGVVELPAARGGSHDHCTVGGRELPRPGEEVGVQVGVRGVGDAKLAGGGGCVQGPLVAASVHRQGAAIAEVDQVGGVAEPFVDHGDQVGFGHVISVSGSSGLRATTRT